MINLKVGSLIKLVGSKHDDTQYVPVVNKTTNRFERLPIGRVGIILKINNAGYMPPEDTDILFLCEEQIYETYQTFIEPL